MESGVKGTPRRLSQGGGEIYRVSLIRKEKEERSTWWFPTMTRRLQYRDNESAFGRTNFSNIKKFENII